jgi:hypothetical protein
MPLSILYIGDAASTHKKIEFPLSGEAWKKTARRKFGEKTIFSVRCARSINIKAVDRRQHTITVNHSTCLFSS